MAYCIFLKYTFKIKDVIDFIFQSLQFVSAAKTKRKNNPLMFKFPTVKLWFKCSK